MSHHIANHSEKRDTQEITIEVRELSETEQADRAASRVTLDATKDGGGG